MAFSFAGLAKLYSYFKVGAEKIDLISETQKERTIHDPTYTWDLSESKEGVLLDEYTRQEIQDAYTFAWYILNTSIAEQRDLGLADRFSKRMIAKIEKGFRQENKVAQERVELNHNIKVHLYSYDRQLLSFNDSNVELVRNVTNIETGITSQSQECLNFDVVMGLEDGYWKIFELVQLETKEEEEKELPIINKLAIKEKIKGINYYPSETPWFDFWKNYNKEIVIDDIQLIKKMGFNHTRIFIPYELFGKGSLNINMLEHLNDFLRQCNQGDITVTLTLFDFPESYQLAFYPATRKHLLQLLDRYKSHPAVSIWDIKNEPDLDFENYGQEVVVDWLEFIIKEAKINAPDINLTIGWSKVKYADLCAGELDLQSFHLYGDIAEHQKHLQKLREEKKITKPLYLSEFGMTSYKSRILPFGSTEKQQTVFTRDAMRFMKQENIDHFSYWTLHDFKEAPKEIIGWKPWIRNAQENMGLITVDGKEKETLINFTEGSEKIEDLNWYDSVHAIYFILPLLLLIFLLMYTKSEI